MFWGLFALIIMRYVINYYFCELDCVRVLERISGYLCQGQTIFPPWHINV